MTSPPSRAAHGQRRGDLLDAARHCFARTGVEATTVEALLAASGASVGSLYQHFKGKDGLAAALYMVGLDAFFAAARRRLEAARSTEDGVKALVRAYFDCAAADPDMVAFLIEARAYLDRTDHAGEIERHAASLMPEIGAWFASAIRTGELRPLAPAYIMAITEGPARHFMKRWLPRRQPALDEAREVLADAAWHALRAPGTGA
jgi:AcrR family transcriptional regulator